MTVQFTAANGQLYAATSNQRAVHHERVGDAITVSYAPTHPTVGLLRSLERDNARIFLIAALPPSAVSVGIGGLVVWIMRWRARRHPLSSTGKATGETTDFV